MKFKYYKPILAVLFAAVIVLGMLYLEYKFPDQSSINLESFLINAATNGKIFCSKSIEFQFIYNNFSEQLNMEGICNSLRKDV